MSITALLDGDVEVRGQVLRNVLEERAQIKRRPNESDGSLAERLYTSQQEVIQSWITEKTIPPWSFLPWDKKMGWMKLAREHQKKPRKFDDSDIQLELTQ